jgi:CheY-like chemotaxis protein
MVRLEVEDDGTGMDAETLARVFEPYFTTKAVGAGSGLGLPQVQAFARQSGGEASIASTPGRGTCVAMLLPAAARVRPRSPRPTPRPARPRARRCASCWSRTTCWWARWCRRRSGTRGTPSRCARRPTRRWCSCSRAWAFDVLFTDIVMPGQLTGLELVEWARVNRPGMPAVVATGYSTQLPPSGVQILRKPYAVEDLLRALQVAVAATAAPAAIRPVAPA